MSVTQQAAAGAAEEVSVEDENVTKLERGLRILRTMCGQCPDVAAEHDVVFAGCAGDDAPEVAEAMAAAGWHRDSWDEGWALFV